MQRIHARVKAKARINIYATIIRAREMNEQHRKIFETNASESADVRGGKFSFWFELHPPCEQLQEAATLSGKYDGHSVVP